MNRNFLLLLQGQMISRIGTQVSTIAMLFWLKHATESPPLMGMMAMLSGLAAVLFGPIGGAVADRHSRRSILIICDLVSGFAVISLAFLMLFTPAAKAWILVWIFAVSIVLSTVNSFLTPAISASTADLVPTNSVAGATSMVRASFQISTLLGQGIGGILFRTLGAPLAILIDGATYLCAALSKYFIVIPQTLSEKNGNWYERVHEFKKEIRDGLTYVRANRGMTQLLLVVTFLNFVMSPILVLLPFYVEDHLKLHPDWFGYLLTALGVGSLMGFLSAGVFPVRGKVRVAMIMACMLVASVLTGLLGYVKTPAIVAAAIVGIGIASGFLNISVMTIVQITTPSEIRGRVFGLLATLSNCLLPIGMGAAGMATSLVGKNVPLVYLFCGACMTLITLAATGLSESRNYLAFEETQTRESIHLNQGIEENAGAD